MGGLKSCKKWNEKTITTLVSLVSTWIYPTLDRSDFGPACLCVLFLVLGIVGVTYFGVCF
jgi:hypothetical protein